MHGTGPVNAMAKQGSRHTAKTEIWLASSGVEINRELKIIGVFLNSELLYKQENVHIKPIE